jgi:hypothetical protein
MSSTALKQGLALPITCVLIAVFAAQAEAQTATAAPPQAKPAEALPAAQKVIDRHVEAVGGRQAIKAHNSISIKGTMTIPANGMTGSLELFAARPNKTVVKTTIAGIGQISEGFDGAVAWSINPMTGPMLASGEELKQKAFDADFDGALNVASRYDAIKTLEKSTFEGRPVYKLALTRKGGGDDIEFYDADTGLKAGAIIERQNPMGTIAITTVVSNYKKFGNLLMPTQMTQTTSGVQIVTTFDAVEFDKVDPATFELPPPIKALVK